MLSPQCTGLSSQISRWLGEGLRQPRLLSQFDELVNITVQASTGPEILALCSAQVGNGPLNLVLDPWPDWGRLTVATPLEISDYRVRLGAWEIDCSTAPRWNPQAEWDAVRSGLASTEIAAISRAATPHARLSPLLALVCGDSLAAGSAAAFAPGLAQLRAWQQRGDLSQLDTAAESLAGLGPGLTPAGDDFLCGLMLGLWATQRSPQALCRRVASRAAPLTTSLSAAFLRRAAAGQVSAAWLALLERLRGSLTRGDVNAELHDVVACGHSSGADTLAGFLWLCTSVAGDGSGARQCA